MKRSFRKFGALLTLLLCLAIKSVSYHALTHSEDDNTLHCELCDFVVSNETTPILSPSVVEISTNSFIPVVARKTPLIITSWDTDSWTSTPLSRPPPGLV